MQTQQTPDQTSLEINTESSFAPSWYNKPTSYAQLISWYQALEALYPGYIEVFKANVLYGTGTIPTAYDDYYIRITNESLGLHKPEVLFLGGPHGDETVGTIGAYWFTDWLMRMAFTDEPSPYYSKDWLRWIIDHREIYIEASHNPYGFDHVQRYDSHGWDLNREADMAWDSSEPTGGVWGSVNGKTLRAFIDNHMVRLGIDFHGGARELLYPWGNTHQVILGTSPISGKTYDYAPPDFYFYDASSLRLGDYMGDYGGNLDKNSIGTIPGTVGYTVGGGIGPWSYGADVVQNPVEDPYVNDETFGNYPGAGLLWVSPEMSTTKNPSQDSFGNDTVPRYGAEVRRVILHQTDLAQPYVRWMGNLPNNMEITINTPIALSWQVNGSMVVDHTNIQYGNNPDPITIWSSATIDHNEHEGDYIGGTGWDSANSGQTSGMTYTESFTFTTPGEYYLVAKAQVDQVYNSVLRPDVYGTDPYLRIIKERTSDTYHEVIQGSDGTEEIYGQTWWYSPIFHISVRWNNNTAPNIPDKPTGEIKGKVGNIYTYSTKTTDPNGDQVYYKWDWGDGNISDWFGPFASGTAISAQKSWATKGTYSIKVKAKDIFGNESDWSDPLSVAMPKNSAYQPRFALLEILEHILERFPNAFPLLRHLMRS